MDDYSDIYAIEDAEPGDESCTSSKSGKRTENVITFDEYFMAMAFLSGKRSKDPNTQVGACIVNTSNKIVATGYNGMPNGCSDDTMPWGKDAADELLNKGFYVCHAEMNAVINCGKSLQGCKIYVSLFPCNECAKHIAQSGIREVIYFSDKYNFKEKYKASRKIFKNSGIQVRQYSSMARQQFVIDFSALD